MTDKRRQARPGGWNNGKGGRPAHVPPASAPDSIFDWSGGGMDYSANPLPGMTYSVHRVGKTSKRWFARLNGKRIEDKGGPIVLEGRDKMQDYCERQFVSEHGAVG